MDYGRCEDTSGHGDHHVAVDLDALWNGEEVSGWDGIERGESRLGDREKGSGCGSGERERRGRGLCVEMLS